MAALDRAGPAEDISSGVAERQHGDGRDQPGRLRAAVPQARGGRLHPHAPLRPHRSPARARVWGGGARTRGRRGLRERCEMTLETVWFCLIAVLWSGYFLLEGFDFGVGMLLPFLPRRGSEPERAVMFESIGPVWDGNEVWLVVAGGATFAAFPAWYATMFSGFYLALLLILALLIVRVVSFEWREKSEDPRWRAVWLWMNTVGSVGASFIWGVALANLLHGVPLTSSHQFSGD